MARKQPEETLITKAIDKVVSTLSFNPLIFARALIVLPAIVQYRFMAAYIQYLRDVVHEYEGGNVLITDYDVYLTAKRILDVIDHFPDQSPRI